MQAIAKLPSTPAGDPIYLPRFVDVPRTEVEQYLQEPQMAALLRDYDLQVEFKPARGVGVPGTVVDQVPASDLASGRTEVSPGTRIVLFVLEGEADELLAQQVLQKLAEFEEKLLTEEKVRAAVQETVQTLLGSLEAEVKAEFRSLKDTINAQGGKPPPTPKSS